MLFQYTALPYLDRFAYEDALSAYAPLTLEVESWFIGNQMAGFKGDGSWYTLGTYAIPSNEECYVKHIALTYLHEPATNRHDELAGLLQYTRPHLPRDNCRYRDQHRGRNLNHPHRGTVAPTCPTNHLFRPWGMGWSRSRSAERQGDEIMSSDEEQLDDIHDPVTPE
jgi:hypothetical protein